MQITIGADEKSKIEVGSRISVKCIFSGLEDGKWTIVVDGSCNLNNETTFDPKIILNDKNPIEEYTQIGNEISVTCKVLGFWGMKPVVQFNSGSLNGSDNPRITLNKISDISRVIQT